MNYRLQDLIDVPSLQVLLDNLYVSSGIPSAIIDLHGQVLTGSGWQEICTRFHRVNQETLKDCIQSDVTIIDGLSAPKRQVQITCPRGLTDTATALIIEGRHLANVFTGQLFIHKPDREMFRQQARRFGFDETAYLAAFERIPIIAQEKLDEYLAFISNLAELLALQGLKQLRILETHRALEESEQRFRTILETTRDGFWVVDSCGNLLEVNAAYCAMSGYRRDELLQMSVPQIEAVKSPEEVSANIGSVLAGERAFFQSTHRRKDGSLLEVEISVQPIPGESNHLFAFIRNMTDRKQAEMENLQLQEQLLQAQKMESIGRLAGGLAHDFNNMLMVIMGHAHLTLSQLTRGTPLHNSLVEIEKAAHRSTELTRQLLAFARKQPVAPQVLDLNETLAGMLKMLNRLIGENIDLVWEGDSQLWPVKMDPSQVDQILANLCVNARDAIAGGGRITIRTDNVTLNAARNMVGADFVPGDYVLLAVADSGCGMDGETIKKIFEPFFTTKSVGEGTGLGLAMVYGIVRQNAGQISVASEPGKGTTFSVYLPRGSSEGAVRLTDQVESMQLGRGETVLLLEDEAAVLEMTQSMLEKLGYHVVTAGTPAEALAQAEADPGKIQLLITDVIMPGMNGRELAARFRAISPETRCLFMSGYTANELDSLGGIEAGVHFIQKPFSLKQLASKVRTALEGKGPV